MKCWYQIVSCDLYTGNCPVMVWNSSWWWFLNNYFISRVTNFLTFVLLVLARIEDFARTALVMFQNMTVQGLIDLIYGFVLEALQKAVSQASIASWHHAALPILVVLIWWRAVGTPLQGVEGSFKVSSRSMTNVQKTEQGLLTPV